MFFGNMGTRVYAISSAPAWAGTPNNIVDFSASSQYDNVNAIRQIEEMVRAIEVGRHVLNSEFTNSDYGIYQVKARLKRVGSPNGNVVCHLRDRATKQILAVSDVKTCSSISTSITIYTFTFATPLKNTVDIDVMIALQGNTNGFNASRAINIGYTGETGRLNFPDDTDGDETTGWNVQTVNNARFTIIEDKVV